MKGVGKISLWSLFGLVVLVGAPVGTAFSASPQAGEWWGYTGFGEISFVVNAEGTGIEETALEFSEACGDVNMSGTVTVTYYQEPVISDNSFGTVINLAPNTLLDKDLTLEVMFNNLGNSAAGYYGIDGTLCEGFWQAFPAGIDTATVTGTLTYPSDASGKSYVVILDNDGDGESEDWVSIDLGVCGSGTTVEFSMEAPGGA
jgi:hypothetical protein